MNALQSKSDSASLPAARAGIPRFRTQLRRPQRSTQSVHPAAHRPRNSLSPRRPSSVIPLVEVSLSRPRSWPRFSMRSQPLTVLRVASTQCIVETIPRTLADHRCHIGRHQSRRARTAAKSLARHRQIGYEQLVRRCLCISDARVVGRTSATSQTA